MQSSGKRAVLTRRQFVAAGAVGGAAVAIGCKVNHQDGRDFLTTEQALTLGAITDQIVPADQFPSATQAWCVITGGTGTPTVRDWSAQMR